jgi:NhaA family Na+:H+ antiporter
MTTEQHKVTNSLEDGFEKVLSPFQDFIREQTTSSLLLIFSTIIALVIANSAWSLQYQQILETRLGIVLGSDDLTMDIRHWINDGLMTFFFFLIGMEIKREILVGELREIRRLALVFSAALGGMLLPAAIYASINSGTQYSHGWGIPMATDTAFVIGLLALLGRHIPAAAFAFLTALAIIDDLGAILVIALFYTDSINLHFIMMSMIFLALLVVMNVLGIRLPSLYLAGGLIVWLFMLGSGIHATVTGILVAATIPARPKQRPDWFFQRIDRLVEGIKHFERKRPATPILGESKQHQLVEEVQDAAMKTTTPLRRWEHAIDQPISLFVMPLFALANVGIPLDKTMFTGLLSDSLEIGLITGLVIGKSAGISLFTWLALRMKVGHLPAGLNMRHITGLALLGGIGFTMSLFMSNLAFVDNHEALLSAKAGILTGSLIAGTAGYIWLRFTPHEIAQETREN